MARFTGEFGLKLRKKLRAKPSYVGCIPSDGIPNAQLWICCIKKVYWQTNLKCDSECWSTALPVKA
ncbi:hypothetical protein PRIPAC_93040 [Pristionchus pacificus]|uniref:Uncharacterized protein n=1 Tax=Pristionchus pacificus TaxID=54126 RepID=A0A2A6BA20_PRIPA|nr:hypothetical protein PRIPAC_93040 [Pristionchus pacificus]|eukprot:PDM62713.1 hypothetical protein PRIPAC_49928 [Pristionchus pacificus]